MKLERYLVDYSSAVLADRKVGNLFLYPPDEHFKTQFQHCARKLKQLGIAMTQFEARRGCLIYVYRPERLEAVLADARCRRCLKQRGYELSSLESLLNGFRLRLKQAHFPHEIGFILGYPIPDVLSFLADRGKNPALTGYWQVYHDVEQAQARFKELQRCSQRFRQCYASGMSLEEIIACEYQPQACSMRTLCGDCTDSRIHPGNNRKLT